MAKTTYKTDSYPYKVYTALLTQSGEDNQVTLSSGAVTKGITYQITANSDGDFSNVGAPNNNENTWFIATNDEIPNSYGTDCQLGYNTGAPVATVLENTIGNVWFTYIGVGEYYVNSDGLFVNNKIFFQNVVLNVSPAFLIFYVGNVNIIELITGGNDNELLNTPIEIRVYN
jgi:hypothetical protein